MLLNVTGCIVLYCFALYCIVFIMFSVAWNSWSTSGSPRGKHIDPPTNLIVGSIEADVLYSLRNIIFIFFNIHNYLVKMYEIKEKS